MRGSTLVNVLLVVSFDPDSAQFNVAAIDQGDFSAFTPISQLDLSGLQPDASYPYWEWIDVFENDRFTVVAAGGTEQPSGLTPELRRALDELQPLPVNGHYGFGRDCPPAQCWQFIAAVQCSAT